MRSNYYPAAKEREGQRRNELDRIEVGYRAAHDLALETSSPRFYVEWVLSWGQVEHPARPRLGAL